MWSSSLISIVSSLLFHLCISISCFTIIIDPVSPHGELLCLWLQLQPVCRSLIRDAPSLCLPFSVMSLSTVLFYACLQVPPLVQSSDFCLMVFLKHDLTTSIAWFLLINCLYLTLLFSPCCWSSASKPSGVFLNTYAGRYLACIHALWHPPRHNRRVEQQLHWFRR